MSAPPQEKTLVQIEVQIEDSAFLNRCFLTTSAPPTKEDVEFYYQILCGFPKALVEMKTEKVPPSFTMDTFGIENGIPVSFPACDLATSAEEIDKRNKFKDYFTKLLEIEKSRDELKTFTTVAKHRPTPTLSIGSEVVTNEHALKARKAWVEELLASLNPDTWESDALIPYSDEHPPYAWLFTPAHEDTRNVKGSKLITNVEIGKKWQDCLGTDAFPDFVVSRRITQYNWAFAHKTTDTLVRAILDWYIASQNVQFENGVSSWLPSVAADLTNMFTPFRKVRIDEKYLEEQVDAGNDSTAVYKLLTTVESTLLGTGEGIEPINEHAFLKYMSHLFRAHNIPRKIYGDMDGFGKTVTRWVHAEFGFLPNVDPPLAAWKDMWHLIMRGTTSAQRVNHFIATLDSQNLLESSLYSMSTRTVIAQEWIKIYCETQLIPDPKSKVKSTLMHDQIRIWCLKFLPYSFLPNFMPAYIGPVLTRLGYNSIKGREGRNIHGVRCKEIFEERATCVSQPHQQAESHESVGTAEISETNSVQFSTISDKDTGNSAQQRVVTQAVTAEKGSTRIEHFFTTSTTIQEIHLGSL